MADIDFGQMRRMPYNLDAEQSVLGSILIDPECVNAVVKKINHQDFYVEEHRDIFLAMHSLFLKNKQIDPVTLIDTLVENGVKDRERTTAYVRTLAEAVPTAANVEDYAEIVRSKSLLRKLIEACTDITDLAFEEQTPAEDVLAAAQSRIGELANANVSREFVHISDVLVMTYDEIKLRAENKGEIGCRTGFGVLDNVLVGLGSGDLVLIGARPGMGKTAFALNIATNIAKTTDKAICIFSLEMSNIQLATRMLSSEAMVDSLALRSGKLSSEQWKKIADTTAHLSGFNIYVDDTAGNSVSRIRAKLHGVKNVGLVVVDYLQLMQSDRKFDSRVLEVGEISRGLKLLAKELGVPVICCAQLSRGPESRTDKRPMLSDLRDSGSIEQDADVVMFLYRDEYYKNESESGASKVEVIIAKNRHGSQGKVELGWFGQYTKFSGLENE